MEARNIEAIVRLIEKQVEATLEVPESVVIRNAVTELVNSYVEGKIDDKELEANLELLKKFGLDDREIELIRIFARKARTRRLTRYGQ
ncbi:MAG: hypothetical protein J7K15_10405 [Deltaproteobacteria bacterium]|nr:hypothetical protein [Deltaproteobacteria bacterium]